MLIRSCEHLNSLDQFISFGLHFAKKTSIAIEYPFRHFDISRIMKRHDFLNLMFQKYWTNCSNLYNCSAPWTRAKQNPTDDVVLVAGWHWALGNGQFECFDEMFDLPAASALISPQPSRGNIPEIWSHSQSLHALTDLAGLLYNQ